VPAIFGLARESLPPRFEDAANWVRPIIDTLAMSVAGTTLAVLISFPLALLAARNTSPHPVVYALARGVLNGLRSVPELIMGIIFVAAVGFGALPGVLALGLHSVVMVGKFFSESIEHVAQEPLEAVRSTGARPLQLIFHGILPQVLPQLADVSIYRWEYNFRASTVMGMVGAGGIGFELMGSLRLMQYQDVSAILIVILLMVSLVDALGARLRRRFA
jgi:phosphonate transport system permease protein